MSRKKRKVAKLNGRYFASSFDTHAQMTCTGEDFWWEVSRYLDGSGAELRAHPVAFIQQLYDYNIRAIVVLQLYERGWLSRTLFTGARERKLQDCLREVYDTAFDVSLVYPRLTSDMVREWELASPPPSPLLED